MWRSFSLSVDVAAAARERPGAVLHGLLFLAETKDFAGPVGFRRDYFLRRENCVKSANGEREREVRFGNFVRFFPSIWAYAGGHRWIGRGGNWGGGW
jgi:hypothetical protein